MPLPHSLPADTALASPSGLANGLASGPVSGLAPWQLARITGHIDRHLAEPLSVAGLAALLGISVGYFSRAFRASMAMPPHAFILARRLARARSMMLATPRGLSQIALDCGFCDQPHLTRRFRRAHGVSPAAWRRSQDSLARQPIAV